MPKMLEGDIKRFCASKRVWIAIIALTVSYAIFYAAVFFLVYRAMDVDINDITVDTNIGSFAEVVSVFTAGFAAIFTAGDFTDGTICRKQKEFHIPFSMHFFCDSFCSRAAS